MSPTEAFAKLCKTTPEAPGINLLGKVPAETALTEAGKELSFNGKEAVSTPLQEVGYPYSVEFQLCPEKTNPISSILFQGPHSVVYTNWENTRRIAFSRDGYTFVFNSYRLPADQWTTIRIEGDYKGTSLYINGIAGTARRTHHASLPEGIRPHGTHDLSGNTDLPAATNR